MEKNQIRVKLSTILVIILIILIILLAIIGGIIVVILNKDDNTKVEEENNIGLLDDNTIENENIFSENNVVQNNTEFSNLGEENRISDENITNEVNSTSEENITNATNAGSTDDEENITYDNGMKFINNEVLITFKREVEKSRCEEIINRIKGKIIASIDITNDYEVQVDYKFTTYSTIEQFCEILKEEYSEIEAATANFVSEISWN